MTPIQQIWQFCGKNGKTWPQLAEFLEEEYNWSFATAQAHYKSALRLGALKKDKGLVFKGDIR